MKNLLITLLFLMFSNSMFSQTPIRKVLYTCKPNEEFFMSEFCSNMKIDGTKFACVLKNNKTNKMSLVWNSEIVDHAWQIYAWYIDLNSKDGNVYECLDSISIDKYEYYIVTDGKKHGPYENLYFADWGLYGIMLSDSNPVTRWGHPNLKIKYANNSFYFQRMGKWYRHDVDGSIYPVDLKDNEFVEYDPTFKSKNGLHIARFSNDYRLLSFDGTSFILDVDLDKGKNIGDNMNCFVSNSGVCVVSNYQIGDFMVKNGKIEYFDYFKDHKYFEPATESIVQRYAIERKARPTVKEEHTIVFSEGQFKVYNKDLPEQWLPRMQIYDSSQKHLFIADFNYDYIMIDEKKIKSVVPIKAFYDETNNAFGWVTIEGKSLVLYSYKL